MSHHQKTASMLSEKDIMAEISTLSPKEVQEEFLSSLIEPDHQDVISASEGLASTNHSGPAKQEKNAMALEKRFHDVLNVDIRYLDRRGFTDADKLNLYAYFKQATVGDYTGGPIRMPPDSAAVNALCWKNLAGMPAEEAQKNYLGIYHSLKQRLYVERELPAVQQLLLSNIIRTNHRLQWLEQNKPTQALLSHQTAFFTSIYPDQLTAEMAHEYAAKVGIRYKRTMENRYLIDQRAILTPPAPVNDAEFMRCITESYFGKLIYPLADVQPASKAQAYLDLFGCHDSNDPLYLVDATAVQLLRVVPSDGFWTGPSVLLMTKAASGGFHPQAIAIESINESTAEKQFPETLKGLTVLTPEDGLAWEMAKIFLLQATDYVMGLGQHVVLHFALMNPIALAVQDALKNSPEDAFFGGILSEHTYLLLATNSFVMHSEYSVLWPDLKQQPYDAFCVRSQQSRAGAAVDDCAGVYALAKMMFGSWKGHPMFPRVNDVDVLNNVYYCDDCGKYRAFLCAMQEVVKAFVRGVFEVVGTDSAEQRFFDELRTALLHRLPPHSTFAGQLREQGDEWPQKLVSYVICNSLEHSLDHFLAGNLADVTHLRIRKPLDLSDRRTDLAGIISHIGEINTVSDRAKYYLLNELTKRNVPVRTFGDLFFRDGGYEKSQHPPARQQALRQLENEFADHMTKLCSGSGSDHLEFRDFATSIQF